MAYIRMVLAAAIEHKFKFVLMILSVVVFAFLLFPFDDLGDLVTGQVAKMTNNQIFVSFDKMKVGVLNPGMQFQNVYLETTSMPPLTAQEINVSPAFSMLVNKKPAGSMTANGFLKGDVEVTLKPATKSESGIERQKITLNAKKLSLSDLKEIGNLPLAMKGRMDLSTEAVADLTFTEQPDVDILLKIEKFELPVGNVQTAMGPLTVPEIKLTSVEIKGRLSSGRLNIEKGTLGREGDVLTGEIKGNMGLTLKNTLSGLAPVIGNYDLSIRLNVKKDLQDRASLFLSFLDAYKTPTPDGARYAFKLSAPNAFTPPTPSALQ